MIFVFPDFALQLVDVEQEIAMPLAHQQFLVGGFPVLVAEVALLADQVVQSIVLLQFELSAVLQ